MNWCISLHWKQLPQRRQEEGDTGGEEGKAGRQAGDAGGKGSGRLERREGAGRRQRKPRGCGDTGCPGGWEGIDPRDWRGSTRGAAARPEPILKSG